MPKISLKILHLWGAHNRENIFLFCRGTFPPSLWPAGSVTGCRGLLACGIRATQTWAGGSARKVRAGESLYLHDLEKPGGKEEDEELGAPGAGRGGKEAGRLAGLSGQESEPRGSRSRRPPGRRPGGSQGRPARGPQWKGAGSRGQAWPSDETHLRQGRAEPFVRIPPLAPSFSKMPFTPPGRVAVSALVKFRKKIQMFIKLVFFIQIQITLLRGITVWERYIFSQLKFTKKYRRESI